MKIELMGWASTGLRCPDVTVDFRTNDGASGPAHVTLIQMPNGTGKTTTLSLIRAAMTGEAEQWSPKEVSDFQKPGEDIAEGKFTLNLLIDGRPLSFELSLDYETGKARYRTTSPGSGGVSMGWNPPPSARRFLDERFTRLFIFDGEFADRLLDPRESEATKAIDALCQLYLLGDLKEKAEAAWHRATKNKTGVTAMALTQRRNRVAKLTKTVRKVASAAEAARKKRESLELEIGELREKIEKQIGSQNSLSEELERARNELRKCEGLVQDLAALAMRRIRQPHLLDEAFGDSLLQLKGQLDRLKLPASTSSQFFEELLEERECVCGRPLDDTTRKVIKERASLYLAEETSGVLNSLKQDIALYHAKEDRLTPDDLTATISQLAERIADRQRAAAAERALTEQLVDQGGEAVKNMQRALEKKTQESQDLHELLEEIERKPLPSDDETTHCLQSVRKQLREAESKLAEITGTIDLHERTKVLQGIIELALEKSRADLHAILVKECNARLEKVLSRAPLQIESIGSCLTLRGQAGASVGQTLSVGYTFLTSLLNRGHHQFPLVVDSPANPLSIEVRREVGKIVPDLCQQFVAFTISSERAGFVGALAENAKSIKYLTMFRKTPGTEQLVRNLPYSGVQHTSSCVLVEGKEYFDGFDVEIEAE